MRIAIAARLAPVAVAISILIAGCSPTTEIVERQGQQYYRHNGLHFELLVPQGWTARSLSSDLAVELVEIGRASCWERL